MSSVVKCDGPGCDEVISDAEPSFSRMSWIEVISDAEPSFSRMSWIKVSTGPNSEPADFHSHECLAKWAAQHPGTSTAVVDGR